VSDLSLALQLGQRTDRLLERNPGVYGVELVEIDSVDP
jgi:hypothetical protein